MSDAKKTLKTSKTADSGDTEDLFTEVHFESRANEPYEGQEDYRLTRKVNKPELERVPEDEEENEAEIRAVHKKAVKPSTNSALTDKRDSKQPKSKPRSKFFSRRRRRAPEPPNKKPLKNQPYIERDSDVEYMSDDQVFQGDLKLEPPNIAVKNGAEFDLETMASVGNHERSHFRAIRFAAEGQMQFYEAIIPTLQNLNKNLHQFVETILTEGEELKGFEISKRTALRNWVLNSPLPYKAHKCHKLWKNAVRNGAEKQDLDIPDIARFNLSPDEVTTPYDFLDVTTRLRLDLEFALPELGQEQEGAVESNTEKRRKLSNVTASTIAQQTFGVEQQNGNQSNFNRWYSAYLAAHPKSAISDLEYLNRMFILNTTPEEENTAMKTFMVKAVGDFFAVRNEDDLNDIEKNGIAVGDVLIMGFTEVYQVSKRENGQFTDKLVEMNDDGKGLSLFISYLHQQYSLREQCEFSNFWREELYRGYDNFVQRKFTIHTLIDNWSLASEISYQKVKKGEPIASRDVFSSRDLAVEDMFGESSPLYFKGNVTYVLLYDKSEGVNQRHRLDLDVLAVITKIEDVEKPAKPGLVGRKEYRIGAKRERLLNQLRAVKDNQNDEETMQRLREQLFREKVNDRKRRLRRASFSAGSRDSSSDSEDSIITEHDSEIEEFLNDYKPKAPTDASVRLKRMEEARAAESINLSEAEKEQMTRIYTKGNVKELTKQQEDEAGSKESWISSTKRSLGKHKASILLFVLAIVSCIVVVALDAMVLQEPNMSFEEEYQMRKIQYAFVGLGIFFFVLSCCLVFIKIFNDAHLVDSRTKFLQTALEGKNFVVTNEDIEDEVDDEKRELNAEEGIRVRKNHRLIVLITNFVSGDVSHNAIDTRHTVSNSIGNITRIADATLKADFELRSREGQDQVWSPNASEPVDDQNLSSNLNWRSLQLSSIQEISSKNTSVGNAVHLAQNESVAIKSIVKRSIMFHNRFDSNTFKSIVKHDTTFHYANFGTRPKKPCCTRVPHPLFRYICALFSLVWCTICLYIMYETENSLGFYLLSLLILPALCSSWEDPIGMLLGLYFAMHYGPGGGLVGKLLVSSHKRTYLPGILTYLYSLLVTALPLVYLIFKIGEAPSENRLETTVDDLYTIAEEELTIEVMIASVVVTGLTVISNISYVASFSRRYYLECLEILSKPNWLFQRVMSLYFAIEWLNLRTETSLFLFNVTTKDSRLLLSEIADLARFFTSGDEEIRQEKNGFGVPVGIGNRGQDALWGLIDKKTKDDIVISPIDPGFKSTYFQASGVSVFAAIYYSINFYRNSVVGLRNATFERLRSGGATVHSSRVNFNAPTLKVKPKNTREVLDKNPKTYQPRGSYVIFAAPFHFGYILLIFLETLLYMPIFAVYLSCYIVSTAFAAVLISPVGLVFVLFEAGYNLVSPGTLEREAPNNLLLQVLSFYGAIVLLIQMIVSFWIKLVITSFLVTIKIILSKLSCKNIEYFVTPKVPLYFLPPLSVTEVEHSSKLKRKRLFKFSDGGYWSGDLPFFSEIPLFPKTHALRVNLVDVRESGDCVVRGKVRSNRDDVVGFADNGNLNEVGLTR